MMLGEPQPTPYDLRFSIFGFPVRISPWFWLIAVMLGGRGAASDMQSLLIWVAVVMLSILIHELGHAFAFQYFGTSSRIVLYHFGGLAVPNAFDSVWSQRMRNPQEQALISVAGPAAQLGSAFVLAGALRLGGYEVPVLGGFAQALLPFEGGRPLPSTAAYAFVWSYLVVSIYWAILNLMPVYPLDGGQIARSLFQIYGGSNAIQQSLMLSVVAGGALAFYGLSTGSLFLALMFASLAYSSYQMMSHYGGGYGGGPW